MTVRKDLHVAVMLILLLREKDQRPVAAADSDYNEWALTWPSSPARRPERVMRSDSNLDMALLETADLLNVKQEGGMRVDFWMAFTLMPGLKKKREKKTKTGGGVVIRLMEKDLTERICPWVER